CHLAGAGGGGAPRLPGGAYGAPLGGDQLVCSEEREARKRYHVYRFSTRVWIACDRFAPRNVRRFQTQEEAYEQCEEWISENEEHYRKVVAWVEGSEEGRAERTTPSFPEVRPRRTRGIPSQRDNHRRALILAAFLLLISAALLVIWVVP
ncbi:hypothetical protein TVH25_21305, partial [Rhodococcus sp. 7Tela_A2]|uniref:hypothetical protein n=1 Tax=Rhodococcus sp. 7Tela_A2 TaxID=3093744 RepID=UPI003BB4EC7E